MFTESKTRCVLLISVSTAIFYPALGLAADPAWSRKQSSTVQTTQWSHDRDKRDIQTAGGHEESTSTLKERVPFVQRSTGPRNLPVPLPITRVTSIPHSLAHQSRAHPTGVQPPATRSATALMMGKHALVRGVPPASAEIHLPGSDSDSGQVGAATNQQTDWHVAIAVIGTSRPVIAASQGSVTPVSAAPTAEPTGATTSPTLHNKSLSMSEAPTEVPTRTLTHNTSTSMTASTTTLAPVTPPPTPSAGPCEAVTKCQADPTCGACFDALSPFFPPLAGTWNLLRDSEQGFFNALLQIPSCAETPLLTAAIRAMEVTTVGGAPTCGDVDVIVTPCMANEYRCFASHGTCSECLKDVYSNSNATQSLLSPACANVDHAIYDLVAKNCHSFPQCTHSKVSCSGECGQCLGRLRAGDAVGAARQCGRSSASHQFDTLVTDCAGISSVACDFWVTRCRQDQVCNACLGELAYGTGSRATLANGRLSTSCMAAFGANGTSNTTTAEQIITMYTNFCPTTVINSCQSAMMICVIESEECARCLVNDDPDNATSCKSLIGLYGVDAGCAPCPGRVHLINSFVIATSAVGSVSVLACLAVIISIIAYQHDRFTMRDRIIVGLMSANAVYSMANVIPISLLHTGLSDCGKYSLVSFEIFVLSASIWTLYYGTRQIPKTAEVCLHLLCIFAGVGSFIGFYFRTIEISSDGYNARTQSEAETNAFSHLSAQDDFDDDNPKRAAASDFSSARSEYDALVQMMLLVWVGFLGLAVIMWLYLRLLFRGLLVAWRQRQVESEEMWNRDLWATSYSAERQTKQRLLILCRQTYEDVAKPLEPLVIVFVLFGVPAALMATDYCKENSSARSQSVSISVNSDNTAISYGVCDTACELALAFRSLATVIVYFLRKERRQEAWALGTLWARLKSRSGKFFFSAFGRSVHFDEDRLERVQMIPSDVDEPSDDEDDATDTLRLLSGPRTTNSLKMTASVVYE